MTIDITDNDPRISYTANANGAQTAFAVPFEFFDNSDLNVYVNGAAKSLGTGSANYGVSGGSGSTGTVTFVSGVTASATVVITRDITIERVTDFTAGADINRASLNTQLDTLTAITADLKDLANRSITLSDPDTSVSTTLPLVNDRKGKTLTFNASTGAVEAGDFTAVNNFTVSDTLTVSGASQLNGTLTVGANDQGYDVTFHGDTAARNVVWDSSADSLKFANDTTLVIGEFNNGPLLEIFSTSSAGIIRNNSTNSMATRSNSQSLQNHDGTEIMLFAKANEYVSLYYNNSVKVKTTTNGVSITGNVDVSGTVDQRNIAADGSKLDQIAASANNYVHPNHSGEVTSTADGATVVASNTIDADNLKVTGDGTTSQFLRSDGDGTFTWAVPTDTNTVYTHPNHSGEVTSTADGATVIASNVVDADNLNVTGNGTSSQFLRSDGDGTFTWAVPTDTNTTYSLASSSALGLVKVGYTEDGKNYPVELSSEKMFVNVPWTDTVYSLPLATSTSSGGIELFSNTDQSVAAESVSTTAGRTYGVQLNNANQAVVNVPWSDTDTNTTYSVGDGGLTQNNFTNADHTKLNGIEASATADQTASEIRTLVESASDSNVFTDADHTKLNGIEASATADQTNAEIRTAVEAASDSNVFTDADHTKLNGVAASANNYVHPNHSGEVTSTADGTTVIAGNVVDEANLKVSNSPTNGYMLTAQSGNTGGLTWAAAPTDTDTVYTHPNHSGEVTSTADGATVIAGNVVDEANLKVSNNPINGRVLTAQSGDAGGLTWANLTSAAQTAGALMDSEVTNLSEVKAFAASDYATASQGTLATNAMPKGGGAFTGAVTTNSTFDGVDIASRDGILTSTTTTANAAVPKAGGTMTGAFKTLTLQETHVAITTNTQLNLATGTSFFAAPNGNKTYTFANPPSSGTAFGFILKVTPSATSALTWPSSVDWAGGSAPAAPASGATNVYSFYTVDGGTTYYGFLSGAAMA